MERIKTATATRRRNYFIDKGFQGRFILKFCGIVVLGGIATISILYLFAMKSTTVAITDSRVVVRTTADFMLPVLLQTVLIVMVLVGIAAILLTLLVSHKIAGPLYRFKKVMEALGEGDFSGSFKIRRLDQLQSLADTFDSMITNVRGKIKALSDNLDIVNEKANALTENDSPEARRSNVKDVKNACAQMKRIISYFKI